MRFSAEFDLRRQTGNIALLSDKIHLHEFAKPQRCRQGNDLRESQRDFCRSDRVRWVEFYEERGPQ